MFAKRSFALVGVVLLIAAGALGQAAPSRGGGHAARYVVRPGDTLWSIAATRYSGDPRRAVWEIEQANGLRGADLIPGQTLVLPGP